METSQLLVMENTQPKAHTDQAKLAWQSQLDFPVEQKLEAGHLRLEGFFISSLPLSDSAKAESSV